MKRGRSIVCWYGGSLWTNCVKPDIRHCHASFTKKQGEYENVEAAHEHQHWYDSGLDQSDVLLIDW